MIWVAENKFGSSLSLLISVEVALKSAIALGAKPFVGRRHNSCLLMNVVFDKYKTYLVKQASNRPPKPASYVHLNHYQGGWEWRFDFHRFSIHLSSASSGDEVRISTPMHEELSKARSHTSTRSSLKLVTSKTAAYRNSVTAVDWPKRWTEKLYAAAFLKYIVLPLFPTSVIVTLL